MQPRIVKNAMLTTILIYIKIKFAYASASYSEANSDFEKVLCVCRYAKIPG